MMTVLWLLIRAGQIMAIVVCFKSGESPRWLKICGGIGACLFTLALVGLAME
jgi:hypothetical protein